MKELMTGPVRDEQTSEARSLSKALTADLRGRIDHLRTKYNRVPQDALNEALEPVLGFTERALDSPPEEATWDDLHALAEYDPDLFSRRWEQIKQVALEELRTGHRAARSVEGYDRSPWKLAEFLAVRRELAEGWSPQNGVERRLIDTMTQAQAGMNKWLEILAQYETTRGTRTDREVNSDRAWKTPRVSEQQAVDQAASMVDRFNRIFLRTLRALRDLRRYSPAVIVQNAGQVNVGQQQLNLSAPEQ